MTRYTVGTVALLPLLQVAGRAGSLRPGGGARFRRWRQACALASAVLACVRLCVSGGGGRLRSRAPAARPSAGWRGSSPLRSGGAGTTDSGAVRGRTRRPTSPASAGDEVGGAGGGARHGCPVRCGRAGWVLLVWCGRIRGHCGLLGGVAGLPAWYRKLMNSAGLGSRLALLSRAAQVLTTNNRRQDHRHNSWQVSARPAFRCGPQRSRRRPWSALLGVSGGRSGWGLVAVRRNLRVEAGV